MGSCKIKTGNGNGWRKKKIQKEGGGGKEEGQGEVKVKKTGGHVHCGRQQEAGLTIITGIAQLGTYCHQTFFYSRAKRGSTYLENSIKSAVYSYKAGLSLPLTTWCQNNDINAAFLGKIERYKSEVSLGEPWLAIRWKPAYSKLLSVYSLVHFWCHADTEPSEPKWIWVFSQAKTASGEGQNTQHTS